MPPATSKPADADAGKPTTRREALTGLRRAEILAAAVKVFGDKGFAATRAEDVAAAANIAKGTLYLYFTSKEAIYEAAVKQAVPQLQAMVETRVAAVSGTGARLAAAIAVRLEFWMEQQSLYRLLLTVGREPEHRPQTNLALRAGHDSFLALLRAGVAAGEIPRRDYDALAWSILDMIRGCNERRLDELSATTPQQDARFITEMTLRHLGLDTA